MARTFLIHACLIFLTFCLGKGTNRWRRIIHNYGRELSPQKRIFDYYKPAIEDYGEYYDQYDEYSKNEYTDLDYNEKEKSWDVDDNLRKNIIFNTTKHKYNLVGPIKTKDQKTQAFKWPKFEDMLLDMGRRYDWKNDRWIKVKKKIKNLEKRKNITSIHEKHKFIYRIVRLNRPKSKRNIVLAVTAVR
ncbi:unnamed protein product [Pieris macdunnoughi]|uniref:Uncharacterized protein n=1 Tax=Pieris macdunnoughi TaxID=345717 RepID=A0A821RW08_9NEOP|nr:unnamed protein product [Pieris macdunnoughi]